jgi:signal transduction histidine kinase
MMANNDSGIVLIIDDNPTNLEVLYSALSSSGYEVLIEMDGSNAIEQVRQNSPDLILLDVMMPEINGFEMCRRLQADSSTKAIPIIFMTALSDTKDKVKGLSLGAVDYITKPFQQEEVLARVRTQLKLRRLSLELEQQKQLLEQKVQERTLELSQTLGNLKKAQLQLVQHEKMSTIGQFVAGIAHEINNPVGFISGNLEQLTLVVKDVIDLLQLYQKHVPHPGIEIESTVEAIDLFFWLDELPKMLTSMKTGIERIRNISTSLRTFSRADSNSKMLVNIHEGLDSTLMILQHRLKVQSYRPAIQVIKNYGEIPLIECSLGQLNQVFMNILANAIDALDESNRDRKFADLESDPNIITITTRTIDPDRFIEIRIEDNGNGIADHIKAQIFDNFFTTKAVGQGTGMGLSISRQIVEETHGGRLSCESTENGTVFVIGLPVRASSLSEL